MDHISPTRGIHNEKIQALKQFNNVNPHWIDDQYENDVFFRIYRRKSQNQQNMSSIFTNYTYLNDKKNYTFSMFVIFIALLFLIQTNQQEPVRLRLHLKHSKKGLTELVNLLQEAHANLLEKNHYEKITHKKNGQVMISLIETKHTKNKMKSQSKNRSKKKKIVNDEEDLLDLEPINVNQNMTDTLEPIDKVVEDGLEGETQLFFKEILEHFWISHEDFNPGSIKGAVPLRNLGNTMFVGPLKVGTDEGDNSFDVIFDTGSALTCITSTQCHDVGCKKSHQYNRKRSNTFKKGGKTVQITFGSGILKGQIHREKIEIDSMEIQNATFIEITKQIGDAFHHGDFDGIVGLGYPHMTGVPTLFDYMIKQHKLEKNLFTFHLDRDLGDSGSTLIFGGLDNDLVEGEWIWHDVVQKFYWAIYCDGIFIGTKNTRLCSEAEPCKVVIDTGTTLLTGPPKDVKKILQMIPVQKKCQNFYSMPSLTFQMKGIKYTLDAQDFILTITNKGVEPPYKHSKKEDIISCAGTLFPLNISPPQGPLWILGDVFISKYAASFNRDTDQVGLSLSKWYATKKNQ